MYYFHVYFYHETSRNKSEYLIGNAFKIHLRATAISKNFPGGIPPDPANKGRGEERERRGEGKGERRDEEGEGRGGARTPPRFLADRRPWSLSVDSKVLHNACSV